MFKHIVITFLEKLSVLTFPFKSDVVLYGTGFCSYAGHTKYRYLKNYETEHSYWVCTRFDAPALARQGRRYVVKGSLKHFFLSLLAKEYYITHNISDVFFFKPSGCRIFNLWHGVAIKHIAYDSNVERVWIDKKLKNNETLPYEKWDVIFAQNEYHKEIIERAMRIQSDRIRVELPDSLIYLKDTVISSVDTKERKTVLYMPTFRTSNNVDVCVRALHKITERFCGDEYDILAKLHPLVGDGLDLGSFPNVSLVAKNIDAIELLGSADILVSDYSSVVYDFSVTERPIYLIHDDIEDYRSEVGGLYDIKVEYELL